MSHFQDLDSCLSRINRAFQGPMAVASTSPLRVTGVRRVSETAYLRANPFHATVTSTSPLVPGDDDELPTQYLLRQNYPNPFNPTTTIEFELPDEAIVTLKIYNLLGQEVVTLIDHEEYDPGVQEVQFSATRNADRLPSGVYLYRIVIEGLDTDGYRSGKVYSQVKKMIIIK